MTFNLHNTSETASSNLMVLNHIKTKCMNIYSKSKSSDPDVLTIKK